MKFLNISCFCGAYYKNHCSQKSVMFHKFIIHVIDCVHVYAFWRADCTDLDEYCKGLPKILMMSEESQEEAEDVAERTKRSAGVFIA